MNSDIVSLIIILICVMLSAYFSATETSFTSLNRIRMKNMAEKGDKRAELVLKLLENFDKLLSTILVGNNIVNIGLSSLATMRRNPRSLRLSPTPDFPGCRCMMMISTTLWELCIRRISTTTFTTPTNR